MKHLHNKQTGFTLLELLLYVSIVGSLLLAVSFFFASTAASKVRNQVENNVNQQAAFAMETITQTIRNSDSVTVPTANNTVTSATFAVPAANKSPTVFELSGNTLQMREGGSAAIALTSPSVAVTNLSFKNTSRAGTSGSVQISFTVSSAAASGASSEFNYQKTFTTSATVRQ